MQAWPERGEQVRYPQEVMTCPAPDVQYTGSSGQITRGQSAPQRFPPGPGIQPDPRLGRVTFAPLGLA